MPKITKKKGIKKSRRNLKRKQTYKKIGGNNDTKHCTCNRNEDEKTATCDCKSNTNFTHHTYENVMKRNTTDPSPPLTGSPSPSVYTGLDPQSMISSPSQASSEYATLNFRDRIKDLKEEIEKLQGRRINSPLTPEETQRLNKLVELLRIEEMKKRQATALAAAAPAAPVKDTSVVAGLLKEGTYAQPRAPVAEAGPPAAEAAYDNLDYNTAGEEKIGQVRQARQNPAYIESLQAAAAPVAAVENLTYGIYPRPNPKFSIPSETSTEVDESPYSDVAPVNLTERYDFTEEQKQNMLEQINSEFKAENLRKNYEGLLGTKKENTISTINGFLNTYKTTKDVDLLVHNLYDHYPELSNAVLGYSSAEDYVAALKQRRMTLEQQSQTGTGKKSKKINKRKSKKNKRKSKKVKKSKSLKAK